MSIELGHYVRATQDWIVDGRCEFTIGTVAQVTGFTLNAATINVMLEEHNVPGIYLHFPARLMPQVWESCPHYALPPKVSQRPVPPK